MLNVLDEKLVVEDKGIYSIENIVARRLMYWQVYLHRKAVVEQPARSLVSASGRRGQPRDLPRPQSGILFRNQVNLDALSPEILQRYILLDDVTVEYCLQQWRQSRMWSSPPYSTWEEATK